MGPEAEPEFDEDFPGDLLRYFPGGPHAAEFLFKSAEGVDAAFQMFPLSQGSKIHMALSEWNQVDFRSSCWTRVACRVRCGISAGSRPTGGQWLQLTIKDLGSPNGVGRVLPGDEPQCLETETVVLPGAEILLPWNASPDRQVRLVMKFDQNGSGTPTISAIIAIPKVVDPVCPSGRSVRAPCCDDVANLRGAGGRSTRTDRCDVISSLRGLCASP